MNTVNTQTIDTIANILKSPADANQLNIQGEEIEY